MKNVFTIQKYDRRSIILYGVVALLSLGYAVGLFFQPVATAPAAFEMSDTARAILKITVAAPIILVWFFGAAAIASSLFRVREDADETLKRLCRSLGLGVGFLIAGLIMGTILGQIRSYYPDSEPIRRIGTILVNYTYVFPPLAGFWFLYRGTRAVSGNGANALVDQNGIIAAILAAIVGVLWTGIIFTNSGRQVSAIAGISPSFYLNDAAIVASIIVPTLLSWFFGIRSALALSDVSLNTARYERERSLGRLVVGIWLLVFSYIIIFGLLAAGGERLLALGLGGILIAIYLFLCALLAAHWLIADSIKRLGKERI